MRCLVVDQIRNRDMIERMENNPKFKQWKMQRNDKPTTLDDYDDIYFKQWILTSEHYRRWTMKSGESGLQLYSNLIKENFLNVI